MEDLITERIFFFDRKLLCRRFCRAVLQPALTQAISIANKKKEEINQASFIVRKHSLLNTSYLQINTAELGKIRAVMRSDPRLSLK